VTCFSLSVPYIPINDGKSTNLNIRTFHRKVLDFTGISLTFKQELPSRPEHISSPPVFSGVRVFLCVFFFCRSLIVLFCHCVALRSIPQTTKMCQAKSRTTAKARNVCSLIQQSRLSNTASEQFEDTEGIFRTSRFFTC
jgi:hypothetical protein